QQQNMLVTYDTTDESNMEIGVQLGCNGVIQVLFEPIDFNNENNPVELLRKVVQAEGKMAIVTFFNLQAGKEQVGTKMLFNPLGKIAGALQDPVLLNILEGDVAEVFESNRSGFYDYQESGKQQQAFIERCLPPPVLTVIGAGNDTQVLAGMADLLGWKVVVIDRRESHANTKRFLPSCQVIVSDPDKILDKIEITDRSYFVLMTHSYPCDLAVLRLLLKKEEVPYIGILGPKKKYQRMLDDLKAEGFELNEKQLSRIYAPVGLNLGAETPAEIGLSVLSEILAVMHKADAEFLRDRENTIHNKSDYYFTLKQV
ncbi:MAG: XdhC family protein, partial [Flavobacteriaceae bacterium]|nr:XdhC family protein [Flavobacteriaceae bacterium]